MSLFSNPKDFAPEAYRAMGALDHAVGQSTLPRPLLELVRMRASQLNSCAYCLNMHSKDARAEGVSEQKLYLLDAWREAPYYSPQERAALEWTEALTLLAQQRLPHEVHEQVRAAFSEQELVALTMAIISINGYNRLSIGLGYHELLEQE